MREYETTVIVQPEISDEGTATLLGKLDAVLEKGGSTRLLCDDLGKRKLAYEIAKFQKGHYYTLIYADEGAVVPELERTLRMEESVLRFMTVRTEDEIEDLEARIAEAKVLEEEQRKRAEERAAREAEEAEARAEVERMAAEEAEQARAQAAEADAGTEADTDSSADTDGDESGDSDDRADDDGDEEEQR